MTTRNEHLDWCKARALEYVKSNDLAGAFASMASDLGKHPETMGHSAIEMGAMLLLTGNLNTQSKMEDFINGFN